MLEAPAPGLQLEGPHVAAGGVVAHGALLVEAAVHDHGAGMQGGGVAGHGGRPLLRRHQLPPVLRDGVDVQLREELPALVERVEGGVGPAAEQQQGVVVAHEAGAGLGAGVGAHGEGPVPRPAGAGGQSCWGVEVQRCRMGWCTWWRG